jgi:hypothetical protein
MPGLMRGIARTAVVAGTATAVSGRVARRQQNRWADQEQQQYQEQVANQPPPPPPAAYAQPVYVQPAPVAAPPPPVADPPADDMSDKLALLQQLGTLKEQGILTDAEFDAQKAKILGS